MNWTEGTLRRNSRGPGWNRDTARRKQYFAEARARAQYGHNGPSSNMNRQSTDFVRSNNRVAMNATNNLRGNSEMNGTASTSCERHLASPIGTEAFQAFTQHVNPANLSKNNAHVNLAQREEITKKGLPDSDDDNLESKRRKLLGQKDWVGIEFQKSLAEGLAPPARIKPLLQRRKGSHLIPRRPGISSHGSHQSRIRSGDYSWPDGSMHLRIGSRDLKWSRENNSIRSPTIKAASTSSHQDRSSQNASLSSPTNMLPASLCTPSIMTPLGQQRSERLNGQHEGLYLCQSRYDEAGTWAGLSLEKTDVPRYVVRSPRPTLHHPQPSRHSQPTVINLRSPASDKPQSVIAQAGSWENSPDRSDSDEDRWQQWLQMGDEPNPSITTAMATDLEGAASTMRSAHLLPSDNAPLYHDHAAPLETGKRGKPGASMDTGNLVGQIWSADGVSQPMKPTLSGPVQNTDFLPDTEFDDILAAIRQPEYHPTGLMINDPSEKMHLLDNNLSSRRQQATDDMDEQQWLKFIGCDETNELSSNAFEAAQNETVRQSFSTAEPVKSIVAEPPSPVREDRYVSICDDDAFDKISLTAGDEFSDNNVGFLEDWTDLAHEQAARQHTSSTKRSSSSKFCQPQRFIGRFAFSEDMEKPQPQLTRRRGRGRPKKERNGYRPNIRSWPNFEEDPIDDMACASDAASILQAMS